MKQWLSLLLALLLLPGLCGCQKPQPEPEGVAFYYCARELAFDVHDSAIQSEYRQELTQNTLAQTLDLYFLGPESDALRSPFPAGLKTVKTAIEDSTLRVTVTQELAALTGLELTLACACLTLTCLALSDAEAVEISAEDALLDGQKSITMDANTLLLLDSGKGE